MNYWKIFYLSLAAILLTGCMARYAAPSSSGPANITFTRGALHLGAKSLQEFEGYKDNACSAAKGTGRLVFLLTYMGTEKRAAVNSSERLYLLAKTSGFSTGPLAISTSPTGGKTGSFALIRDICANLVSFTPRAGAAYRISQEQSGSACDMSVIDVSTGSAPLDLVLESPQTCAAHFR